MIRPRHLFFCWLLAALGLAAGAAQAASIEWRKPVFVYVAQDKRLAEVLQEFAASQNITAVADKAIDEKVSVSFRHHPNDVLRLLTANYGLIWYYDGRILYFYKASDAQSRVVRLQNISIARLKASVRRLGIEDTRYPLVYDEAELTVMVSGPRRYVETVTAALLTLDQGRTGWGAEEVRVFPLRFAWAQDKTVGSGEGSVTMPGVATLLKKLFQGSIAASSRRDGGSLAGRRGRALTQNHSVDSSVIGRMEVPAPMDEAIQQFHADREGNGRGDGLPQIEADGQLNAVIVRDASYRMAWYTKLIESLDVKPARVEIEVKIIDVEARSRERLGVRWQSFNGGSGLSLGMDGGSGGDGSLAGLGGTVSSVLSRGNTVLFANIDALLQEGKARIVAQPKVLTLNNVEATLSNTETYYVKVAGNISAELFNVTSGTRMRVTPLLSVDEMGSRAVKMQINAQDGGFSGTNVEQLPVVKTRDIQTQAVVREGESLLIGGMVYESDSVSTTGVPGLSKIPLLGVLFRGTETVKVKMERLFLITPKVIEY